MDSNIGLNLPENSNMPNHKFFVIKKNLKIPLIDSGQFHWVDLFNRMEKNDCLIMTTEEAVSFTHFIKGHGLGKTITRRHLHIKFGKCRRLWLTEKLMEKI